jgi:hypothetical protein
MRSGRRNAKGMRFGAAVLCAGALAAGTYAFTAANSMPANTRAGDGTATVTGYIVNNVQYNAQASDPTLLQDYKFDLSAPARFVKAKAIQSQTGFDNCSNGGSGNTWTCTPPLNTTIASLNELRVIATD